MIEDWDDAYANGDHIPDAAAYPPRWSASAAAFRDGLGARAGIDRSYGDGPRHRFDLFAPEGESQGLVVFVHGGYWRAFDKSAWSWMAAGPLARGWSVAMPSYTLAPGAHIAAIAVEAARAVEAAASRVAGPIRLIGHSAGGHLVTRMVCENGPLAPGVAARVAHVLSLSGVHDLRPLLRLKLNADLRLTPEEAAAESPALLTPRDGARVTCWAGAEERPEFRRQNALLANIWAGLGAAMTAVEEPARHHFDVIDGLAEADSPLTTALLAS